MLSLSHTSGYAIIALGCIGNWKGERVLATQIQKCTGVPMPYLRKILYTLGKSGLIETKRGYRGGFVLARPPQKITLLDVVRAMKSTNVVPDCLLELPGCSDATPCPLRVFWQKERARIEAKLARITVAEASDSVRNARWGRLTKCPPDEPEDAQPKKPRRKPATRTRLRRTAKAGAKGRKARSA